MLTKRQLLLLIFAILAVLLAAGTLLWMRSLEKQMQQPMGETFELPAQTQAPEAETPSSSDPLQSEFDAMLSGEAVAEMYEGMDYGFTAEN